MFSEGIKWQDLLLCRVEIKETNGNIGMKLARTSLETRVIL